MNTYPVKWVKVERFCELTSYTVEAVRVNRKRGIWPDGIITKVQNNRLHVNLEAYDRWVENGTISRVA